MSRVQTDVESRARLFVSKLYLATTERIPTIFSLLLRAARVAFLYSSTLFCGFGIYFEVDRVKANGRSKLVHCMIHYMMWSKIVTSQYADKWSY